MTLDKLQIALKQGFKALKIPKDQKEHVHVDLYQDHVTLHYQTRKVFIKVREVKES